MAKMPFAVGLEKHRPCQGQLLVLNLFLHPDTAQLLVGRELELFVYGSEHAGDSLPGRYSPNAPVVIMACAGHVSIRTRWVDDEGESRDCVFGTFTDRAEVIVIPPEVHYQITTLSGHSRVVGFKAWPPGQCGLDEVLDFPPGYDDNSATPPDRR